MSIPDDILQALTSVEISDLSDNIVGLDWILELEVGKEEISFLIQLPSPVWPKKEDLEPEVLIMVLLDIIEQYLRLKHGHSPIDIKDLKKIIQTKLANLEQEKADLQEKLVLVDQVEGFAHELESA